jgi:hypothetical protein
MKPVVATNTQNPSLQSATIMHSAEGLVHQDNRLHSSGVFQLGKKNGGDKKRDPFKRMKEKQKLYEQKPHRESMDLKEEIQSIVERGRARIATAKEQVEDDGDIELLNSFGVDFSNLNSRSIEKLREIRNARVVGSGKTRSQTSDRDKLVNELRAIKGMLYHLLYELNATFPLHSGGFGATGRAHAIDTEINPSSMPLGKTLDNTFVNDIAIDGVQTAANVYKATPKVGKEKAGQLLIMGHSSDTIHNKPIALRDLESHLSAINTPQEMNYTSTPVARDRGDGQYKNMGNTSAAGYAWLTNIPNVLTQRWEWLHIRGAGLGGATDSTNLVAGTRDANTQMIPFESNIRLLGTAVKNNASQFSRLHVIWSTANQIARHVWRYIRIRWELIGTDAKVKTHGDAWFDATHTGSNISKKEVELLENALSQARTKAGA